MKLNLTALFFLITLVSFSQVVINEFDCDSPGTDDKEFVELKSVTPNYALDDLVLVFFNGSSNGEDRSYYTIDLDGGITDVNGLFVIASNQLNPLPQMMIPENMFQNGADGIGLYTGSSSDFPDGTLATTTNLVDAMVYGTNDSDDSGLMALLGETIQYNDNGTNANPKSIQRYVDAMGTVTFASATPTPRQENDGSGVIMNTLEISVSESQYNEGETFDITFTSQNSLNSDYTFDITLENGNFNTSDFIGITSLTILSGQTSVSTTVTLVDDILDEGDEVLEIRYSNLQLPLIAYNDFMEVRVMDNDFTVAAYGTPLNPTYGIVASTQPTGYYDTLNGKSDAELEQAIQDIIANPSIVRAQTYSDIIDILAEADKSPEHSNKVWLVYSEQSRPIIDYQTGSTSTGKWNREHTFPRSLANYGSIQADNNRDGKDVFWATEADSLRHGNSDAHALRAADGPENSSRGNQHYGEYNGPTGNQGSFKGDVARSVLFLQLRYNGLSVENGYPDVDGQMGDLATLLDWHRNDPPDDFEMNRNNVIYTWQINRNPLIDMPDLVEHIWGTKTGIAWNNSLSNTSFSANKIIMYPNPSKSNIKFSGLDISSTIEIFNVEGRKVISTTLFNNETLEHQLKSGFYLVKIKSGSKIVTKKLLVN